MTKKPSPRNKEWEKERRDRLNKTFEELARLLPEQNTSWSKIEILQNSIKLILELTQKLKEISGDGDAASNCKEAKDQENIPNSTPEEQPAQKDVADRPKRKYTRREKKIPIEAVAGVNPSVESDSAKKEPLRPLNETQVTRSEAEDTIRITKKKAPFQFVKSGCKTKIVLKNRLYKDIKRHVLEKSRKRNIKFRRKKLRLKSETLKKQKENEDPTPMQLDDKEDEVEEKVAKEPVVSTNIKPSFEIHDLITSQISHGDDLFVALPQEVPHSGLLSPTEAFLMSFPVVGSKPHEQPISNTFSPKDDNLVTPGKSTPASTTTSSSSSSHNKPLPAYATPLQMPSTAAQPILQESLKPCEGHTPFSSNSPFMDTHLSLPEKQPITFTFSLTTTTTSAATNNLPALSNPYLNPVSNREYVPNRIPNDPPPIIGSSLTTDTKTTNSWSYKNKKKVTILDAPPPLPQLNELPASNVLGGYANAQPFSFSLTSTNTTSKGTVPEAPVMATNYSKDDYGHHQMSDGIFKSAAMHVSTSSCTIFDNYNAAASYNSFPNAFLGSTPTDCQFGTNSFSFQLKPSSDSQSTATTTTRRPSKTAADPRREKSRKSGTGDAKKAAHGHIPSMPQSKSHVNWMTDSPRDYPAAEDHQFAVPPINQPLSSYLPVPQSFAPAASSSIAPSTTNVAQGSSAVMFLGDDYNQKSDIFFAHPPGEERFLWSQLEVDTDKRYNRFPTEFNVPQLLPPAPAFTQSDANTAPLFTNHEKQPVTGQAVPKQQQQHQQPIIHAGDHSQLNFSVSNLVGHKKHSSNSNASVVTGSGSNKWKCPSTPWQLESARKSASKNYSAEALIGSHSSSNYSAAAPSTTVNDPFKMPSSNKRFCINPIPEHSESDPMDFSYNLMTAATPQFGQAQSRPDTAKIGHQMQEAPFAFFPNDFMQPPPLFPPLLSDHNPGMKSKQGTSSGGKVEGGAGHKRKSQFEGGPTLVAQPNEGHGAGHQSNYGLASSSYFPPPPPPQTHAHPPPSFLINPDSFNYSENNNKFSQSFVGTAAAPPPLDFHSTATTTGLSNNYSNNYLPNFNLSSICPEINNSIH